MSVPHDPSPARWWNATTTKAGHRRETIGAHNCFINHLLIGCSPHSNTLRSHRCFDYPCVCVRVGDQRLSRLAIGGLFNSADEPSRAIVSPCGDCVPRLCVFLCVRIRSRVALLHRRGAPLLMSAVGSKRTPQSSAVLIRRQPRESLQTLGPWVRAAGGVSWYPRVF